MTGCNYPRGNKTTATANAVLTIQSSINARMSETPRPSSTLLPSETSLPTDSPGPSDTPGPTSTLPFEEIGLVILNTQEIGTIQKSGEKFIYIPNPNVPTPEVKGKVLLQIENTQEIWEFDLESSSEKLYSIQNDTRSGWEGYGMLLAYKGEYEITVKFIAHNLQTGEELEDRVYIEIFGATVIATNTPEIDIERPIP